VGLTLTTPFDPALVYVLAIVNSQHPRKIVVTSGKTKPRDANLLEIIRALGAIGLFTRLGQGWQQHAGQDANDGNHYEKFNEGKSLRL
jgi:hypothetical protein